VTFLLGRDVERVDSFLTSPTVEKVVNATTTLRDKCILKMLAQTGMKRVELYNLDVPDVDLDQATVTIRERGSRSTRAFPISDDLLVDLRHLLGRRQKGPVFTNSRGERLGVRQINNVVSTTGKRAGVLGLTCKALREFFVYEWKSLGRSRKGLARILG